jgi:hypothetical protein
MRALELVLAEPPFRLIVRALLRALPAPPWVKARWDACSRPHYLIGLLHAAQQARREGRPSFAAIEFGVAGGDGLLILQAHAAAVERATSIQIRVYGFDTGGGLPDGTRDYRDHPDIWQAGDFAMDVAALEAKLDRARTALVLGEISKTVISRAIPEPLGFVIIDVDLYSSTVDALRVLCRPDVPRLRHVAMYFDDVRYDFNYEDAGELLAIDEFNAASSGVRIRPWRGLRDGRPFPEAAWLAGMYMAHDLSAVSHVRTARPAANWWSTAPGSASTAAAPRSAPPAPQSQTR